MRAGNKRKAPTGAFPGLLKNPCNHRGSPLLGLSRCSEQSTVEAERGSRLPLHEQRLVHRSPSQTPAGNEGADAPSKPTQQAKAHQETGSGPGASDFKKTLSHALNLGRTPLELASGSGFPPADKFHRSNPSTHPGTGNPAKRHPSSPQGDFSQDWGLKGISALVRSPALSTVAYQRLGLSKGPVFSKSPLEHSVLQLGPEIFRHIVGDLQGTVGTPIDGLLNPNHRARSEVLAHVCLNRLV